TDHEQSCQETPCDPRLRPWSRSRASSPRTDSDVMRPRVLADARLCSLWSSCPAWMWTECLELAWWWLTSPAGVRCGRWRPVGCDPTRLVAGIVTVPMTGFGTATGA